MQGIRFVSVTAEFTFPVYNPRFADLDTGEWSEPNWNVRFAKWEMAHPGAQQLGFTRFDVMAIGRVPTFLDIDDVDSVYRLIPDLQMEARVQRTAA